ncbi:hypothetical protein MHYP_G00134970 [Metynnis hypsauchen]
MCLSNNKVLVYGSFIDRSMTFSTHLTDPTSQQYINTVQKYQSQLEPVYSTLGWFDFLKITGFRKGSLIGDFMLLLTAQFEVAQLETKTTQLENGSLKINLTVTGITSIPQIQQPVPYNTNVSITCCKPEKLSRPMWSFQKNAQPSQNITNGTEASVISNSQNSTVYISETTEVWKGTFTCDYKSDQSDSIRYRASLYLDIALLPQIIIISDPQFPSCIRQTNLDITVKCIIPNTTENYSVNWTGREPENNKPDSLQNGLISYQTNIGDSCAESLEWVNVTCVFVNRLNQTTNTTLHIPVIQVIVIVTFITYDNGSPGSYYSGETCWLIYEAALKGSIHAFLFPVFIIVFVNMFTMVVVISRILKPTLSEGSSHDEKEVARSIVKTIVLLTPTLGITWILGLFVLMLDLTTKPYAQIVNYAFTFFNSFQGFFILLTGCFGEKKIRDALLKRFGQQHSVNYKSESSSRITSATKRK